MTMQDHQRGQREGHRDLAGDGEAARHHAEEIAEQHEDEEGEDEGEEFQPVFAGRRMDHVGDEFVGHLRHRLAAGGHQPARLDRQGEEQRRRDHHDHHQQRLVGEDRSDGRAIWNSGLSRPTIGLTANCSIGFRFTNRSPCHSHRPRSLGRDLGVNLVCRAHHIADPRRRAQHEKHDHEDRAGVKSEMAATASRSPIPGRPPRPAPPPVRSRNGTRYPTGLAADAWSCAACRRLGFVEPLAQIAAACRGLEPS